MIKGQRKRGEKTTTNGGKESNIRQAQRGRGGGRGRRAAEGGEVNVFWRAMGRRDNKRKKRQRMRAAAAAAATAAARLCNINLRRADQKAGELSCVPAESERWREFLSARPSWTNTRLDRALTASVPRCTASTHIATSAAQDVGNATHSGGEEGSIHSEVITSHQPPPHFLIWVTTLEFHSRITPGSSTDTTRQT